jgi:uncharacterized membrane protein YoaK (UPF0700 family)
MPLPRRLTAVVALTLATGAVDAVSYFSFDHVFTANMSGNIALLGIGIVNGPTNVLGNACALAGFAGGSLLASRLFGPRSGTEAQRAARMLMLELGLLVCAVAAIIGGDVHRIEWQRAVCSVVATAMGLQTGVGRLLAVTDVNTTVATMTLHDLVAASRLAGGDSVRWQRRAAAVLALLVGASVGLALDRLTRAGGLAFTCSAVAIAFVVLNENWIRRSATVGVAR